MPDFLPPAAMAPAERLAEVSAILARGVLALRRKARPTSSEESAEPGENGLDSGRDVRPDVDAG